MSDAPELLPCPFCGGEAIVPRWEGQPARAWALLCQDCGGTTRATNAGVSPAGTLIDLNAAAAAWNRRATLAALAASPEVQAMIRDAEARGMERAADILLSAVPREFGDHRDYRKAIRAEAAALKGETK